MALEPPREVNLAIRTGPAGTRIEMSKERSQP